jgi:hypothetical protein
MKTVILNLNYLRLVCVKERFMLMLCRTYVPHKENDMIVRNLKDSHSRSNEKLSLFYHPQK